jgi:hypothetical protein
MTGKTKTGASWHSTTVVLQAEIYRRAMEQGIDISDACNQALAGLTGCTVEHRPPQRSQAPPPPVIIAKNGAGPAIPAREHGPAPALHPVINADDPAAPAKVVQTKARPHQKGQTAPAGTPGGHGPAGTAPPFPPEIPAAGAPVPEPAAPAALPVKKPAAPRGRTRPAGKRGKTDALKAFFAAAVHRTGDTGDRVGKDELYERFARFCREHQVTPVPDRRAVTVALKNQYALTEKAENGKEGWVGIRLT